ncbi:MAG: MerR family transcriptional regulator [Candidatus Dadabacteria bacterium]|nr:MAG: MerR family transcriptional regulator [Candidatus Dadabacteria bacterium]
MRGMTETRYTIDDLVEKTGFSRRRIRYYVAEGLLDPPAGRGRGGFYFDSHLERLLEIRRLTDQGLRLAAIRERLREPRGPRPRVEEPVPEPAPAGERWVRFVPADGVEIHLREDVARRVGEGLRDLLRHARSLTKGEEG